MNTGARKRGLLDERDDRLFDERGERGGADGGEGREQEAVRETLAVARLLPVLVVIVDRMVVAGHAREEREVGVGQGPRRALEPVPDLEVLEIALGHQAFQNAS